MANEPAVLWHGRRKLWHVSACLLMLPLFFSVKYWLLPVHYVGVLTLATWTITVILLIVDLARMYYPASNDFLLSLPLIKFFKSIWRQHEITGYAASTYAVMAMAVIITLVFFGLTGEQTLVASILALALCDPAAAWGRFCLIKQSPPLRRFGGLLWFVVCCCLILFATGWFYGEPNIAMLLAAALTAGACEAYIPELWRLAAKVRQHYFGPHAWPRWFANIFFDDNLTAPLALALMMMLFGY